MPSAHTLYLPSPQPSASQVCPELCIHVSRPKFKIC